LGTKEEGKWFSSKKLAKEMRVSEEEVEQALAGPIDGVSRFRCYIMDDGKSFFQPHAKQDENKRKAGGSFSIYDSGTKESKAKRSILEKMYIDCTTHPAPEGPPFSLWGQSPLKEPRAAQEGGSTQEIDKPARAPSTPSPIRAEPRRRDPFRSRSPSKKPRVEEVEETPAQMETDWRELRRKANIRIMDIEQDKIKSREDRAEAADTLEVAKFEKLKAEDAYNEATALATEARKHRDVAKENREATRVLLEQAQVQTDQLKSYLLQSAEGGKEAKDSLEERAKSKTPVEGSRSKSKHKATRTVHKKSKQGHKDRQPKKASSSHAPALEEMSKVKKPGDDDPRFKDKTHPHKVSYDKTRKTRQPRKKPSSSSSSEEGSSSSD
jgi:hypothetical protein